MLSFATTLFAFLASCFRFTRLHFFLLVEEALLLLHYRRLLEVLHPLLLHELGLAFKGWELLKFLLHLLLCLGLLRFESHKGILSSSKLLIRPVYPGLLLNLLLKVLSLPYLGFSLECLLSELLLVLSVALLSISSALHHICGHRPRVILKFDRLLLLHHKGSSYGLLLLAALLVIVEIREVLVVLYVNLPLLGMQTEHQLVCVDLMTHVFNDLLLWSGCLRSDILLLSQLL